MCYKTERLYYFELWGGWSKLLRIPSSSTPDYQKHQSEATVSTSSPKLNIFWKKVTWSSAPKCSHVQKYTAETWIINLKNDTIIRFSTGFILKIRKLHSLFCTQCWRFRRVSTPTSLCLMDMIIEHESHCVHIPQTWAEMSLQASGRVCWTHCPKIC